MKSSKLPDRWLRSRWYRELMVLKSSIEVSTGDSSLGHRYWRAEHEMHAPLVVKVDVSGGR